MTNPFDDTCPVCEAFGDAAADLKTGDVVNDDRQYGTITVDQVRLSGPYVWFTGTLSDTQVRVRRVWKRTDRITLHTES